MKTPRYKAIVYLAQEIEGPQGKGLACLETRPCFDKNSVVNYARTLHNSGIALAYRICHSPDGNLENWYKKVKAALDEVRKYHPEVTMVAYNIYGNWNFTDSEFNSPEKWDQRIDVGVLEDAMESMEKFPAIFSLGE